MGFPTSMFTVLFAVARTVGWISQWSEMIEDPLQKRPSAAAVYRYHPSRLRPISPSASNSTLGSADMRSDQVRNADE